MLNIHINLERCAIDLGTENSDTNMKNCYFNKFIFLEEDSGAQGGSEHGCLGPGGPCGNCWKKTCTKLTKNLLLECLVGKPQGDPDDGDLRQ